MKTFKQYLGEATQYTLPELQKMIEEQCQPFLQMVGGWKGAKKHVLYRGMRRSNNVIWNVRKNRKPKTSSAPEHNAMNAWFERKFGIKHRSESMFCSADVDVAAGYGRDIYAVFPIGNFEFAYAAKDNIFVQDLLYPIRKKTEAVKDDAAKVTPIVDEVLDGLDFTDQNLLGAMKKRKVMPELMINCDSYIAIPLSVWEAK